MITDHFLVTDKIAIVTGAGRGIGRASALALAEAGADVVISARSVDELDAVAETIRGFGRRAVVVAGDLSDLDVLPTLVTAAVEQLGGVDIVVNNVGGSFPRPLLETSSKMFEKAFHFNVTTALELSKAAIPHMLERDGGSIVNISSVIGRLSDRGFAAYGTAKAALSHLTRLMAEDCAPKIRVNAIGVGSTATSALRDGAHRRPPPDLDGREHPPAPVGTTARHRARRPLPLLACGQLHHRQDPRHRRGPHRPQPCSRSPRSRCLSRPPIHTHIAEPLPGAMT